MVHIINAILQQGLDETVLATAISDNATYSDDIVIDRNRVISEAGRFCPFVCQMRRIAAIARSVHGQIPQ